jgi:hypothetical protein
LIKHVPHKLFDETKRSGLRVTGSITKVIHGTYYERPSLFVGYDISHNHRKVPETKVRLNVFTGGRLNSAASPIQQPFIDAFAPEKHNGEATPVDKGKSYTFGGKVGPPSAIMDAGLDASTNRSTSFTLNKRHTITAHTSSIAGEKFKTVLELEAKENSGTEDGVYDRIPMGTIIVTRGNPVVITLDIIPTQHKTDKLRLGPKGFYAAPVWIGKGDWGLDGMPEGWTRKMEDWDTNMWKHLVKYHVEGQTVSRFLCHFKAVLWLI